jgi:hypothetical protein
MMMKKILMIYRENPRKLQLEKKSANIKILFSYSVDKPSLILVFFTHPCTHLITHVKCNRVY